MAKSEKLAVRKRTPGEAASTGSARDETPTLFLRIKFGGRAHIGPGKIRLMELIGEHGSISAAGKAMGMSYRRAWLIVDDLNHIFPKPLIAKQTGGSGGGGASLTRLGNEIVRRYRRIEKNALAHCADDLKALTEALKR